MKQASPKAARSPRSSSVRSTKVKVPKAMIVSTVNPLCTQSSFRLNGINCRKSCFQPSRYGTWKLAKGDPLSHSADQPRGWEQTRQTRHGIPADMDFTYGGDDVQLPQALIQIETALNGEQYVCADGQADGVVLMIEGVQPRNASLTNLALPVIEHPVRWLCARLLISLFGDLGQ